MKVRFGVRANEGRSFAVSREMCRNAYVQIEDKGGKEEYAVYRSPGIRTRVTLATGPVRGGIEMGGNLYVVSGSRVYKIDSDWNETDLGGIPGAGPVSIAQNGSEVAIAAESKGYIVTTSSVTQITDSDFVAPSYVTAVDGYFVWIRAGTDVMGHSALDDGLDYSATDFFTAEGESDTLIGLFVDKRELWAFGTQTGEIFVADTGGSPAFRALSTAYVDKGLMSPFVTAEIDNSIVFVGSDGIVYRIDGYNPKRISTSSVEDKIAALNRVQQRKMDALVYTCQGHPVYALTSDEWTLAYDVASGEWHERQSDGYTNWRAIALNRNMDTVFATDDFSGVYLVGDRESGRVGEIDPTIYTEFGETVRVVIRSEIIHDFPREIQADSFHLDIQSGVGIETGQGSDPQLIIRFTDDLGVTWSHDAYVSAGKIGETFKQITLNRQGTIPPAGRVYELDYSEPTAFAVLGADLQLERGEVDG